MCALLIHGTSTSISVCVGGWGGGEGGLLVLRIMMD